MSPDLGKIKGNTFREFLVWYESAHGADALSRAHAAVPAPYRGLLDGERRALGVLASSWYDARLVHVLLEELTRGRSETEVERFIDEGSRATLRAMMRGVQKVAFDLLVSPARLPRIINMLWGMTYDSGEIRVIPSGERCHESVTSGWRGHHPLVCRINMHATIPMYEAMGCRSVRYMRTSCVSDGKPDCRSLVRWGLDSATPGR